MDYKNAGVDIEAGYKSVELMKEHVKKTLRPEVLGGLGGFSGAFSLAKIKEMEEPVLLSGTDGCGTKVKLAMIMDKHDTIGIDAVAMCVNDIACAGGEPLFFLDYIACGKNYPEKIASIVKGVAEGCLQSEAALIGGETAEHPGLMPEDEYDLAGFAVGVCDKKDMITGEDLKAGDVLIGMASTGVHSNGFSLVRKVFEKELNKEAVKDRAPSGKTTNDTPSFRESLAWRMVSSTFFGPDRSTKICPALSHAFPTKGILRRLFFIIHLKLRPKKP